MSLWCVPSGIASVSTHPSRKAGDLNSIPATLPITVIQEHAGLSDSWLVTHPDGGASSPATTPLDAIVKHGVTADSPLNTYSAGKPLDGHASRFLGKRLDYILYRQPIRLNEKCPVIKASECKVVMTSKVPGYDVSFSDHFGVEATLEIDGPDEYESTSVWRSPASPNTSSMLPPSELSSASTATVIQALTACYRFSRRRARRELTIFGLCLLLLFAITVGTAWLPHTWIDPIFCLLTIFIAWLATTMLYEGFLYGNWECNALMNVIEELEIYQKGLEIQFQRSNRNF
jgi:sphingomyelin phosphodiesterase 2